MVNFAGYSDEQLADIPSDAVVNSFGCGNPVALAGLREGDTVLDLGSGAGIDLLLAARLVGPQGRVIGVDMTDEMIAKARENAEAAGLDNIEVRKGIIEELPVDDSSVDWVISNCVINLSPEKSRVFAEIARVLRPRGRMLVSDMMARDLPEELLALPDAYSSCVAGAIDEDEYLAGLRHRGPRRCRGARPAHVRRRPARRRGALTDRLLLRRRPVQGPGAPLRRPAGGQGVERQGLRAQAGMSAQATEMAKPDSVKPRFDRPIADLIRARYSCRTYLDHPIASDAQRELAAFLGGQARGPLGSPTRFSLVAASPGDSQAISKLGTYGCIKGATGFIVGAVGAAEHDLEDFGYLLEESILFATGLGLGTCWLGGTFAKGSFVKRLGGFAGSESMPAVVSLGYPGEDGSPRIREREVGDRRLAAPSLFFEKQLGRPMTASQLAGLGPALEAVRMAPSASNKQPWRIVHRGRDWHFYLVRTKGYGKESALFSVLRLADMQRVDMGIAMCHLELAARELGLAGTWTFEEPGLGALETGVEYTATWRMDAKPALRKEMP